MLPRCFLLLLLLRQCGAQYYGDYDIGTEGQTHANKFRAEANAGYLHNSVRQNKALRTLNDFFSTGQPWGELSKAEAPKPKPKPVVMQETHFDVASFVQTRPGTIWDQYMTPVDRTTATYFLPPDWQPHRDGLAVCLFHMDVYQPWTHEELLSKFMNLRDGLELPSTSFNITAALLDLKQAVAFVQFNSSWAIDAEYTGTRATDELKMLVSYYEKKFGKPSHVYGIALGWAHPLLMRSLALEVPVFDGGISALPFLGNLKQLYQEARVLVAVANRYLTGILYKDGNEPFLLWEKNRVEFRDWYRNWHPWVWYLGPGSISWKQSILHRIHNTQQNFAMSQNWTLLLQDPALVNCSSLRVCQLARNLPEKKIEELKWEQQQMVAADLYDVHTLFVSLEWYFTKFEDRKDKLLSKMAALNQPLHAPMMVIHATSTPFGGVTQTKSRVQQWQDELRTAGTDPLMYQAQELNVTHSSNGGPMASDQPIMRDVAMHITTAFHQFQKMISIKEKISSSIRPKHTIQLIQGEQLSTLSLAQAYALGFKKGYNRQSFGSGFREGFKKGQQDAMYGTQPSHH